MSPKKILFFIIIITLFLAGAIGILYVSNQKKPTTTGTKSLKIWINKGATEDYVDIITGFKKYAPEYKNTEILIEKQTSDADRYRSLLLGTLSDQSGPDIFMVQSGEDAIVESKIAPIPETILNFSDFDQRYDDVFRYLITTSGSGNNKVTSLKGVPLGYETLGVFYNKSLLREVPKTWNDIERLYEMMPEGIYASNLGLGPIYVPNMVDILPLWFSEETKTYASVGSEGEGLKSYLSYGNIKKQATGEDTLQTPSMQTLQSETDEMLKNKLSTLDLFMQGKIAMILGYPSIISELELAGKRVNSDISSIILTERIPQESPQKSKNIARYSYFAVSKISENGGAAAKFLEYLMTEEAEKIFLEKNPYLIPAQISFYQTKESTPLSQAFTRAKLGSFIPKIGESIGVFDYGIKQTFINELKTKLDTSRGILTEEEILSTIAMKVECDLGVLSENGGKNCGE